MRRCSRRQPTITAFFSSAQRQTVATATTQITIRGIPRHGKLKNSDYSLLAQFGLTPKSKRGLAASDPGEVVDPLDAL